MLLINRKTHWFFANLFFNKKYTSKQFNKLKVKKQERRCLMTRVGVALHVLVVVIDHWSSLGYFSLDVYSNIGNIQSLAFFQLSCFQGVFTFRCSHHSHNSWGNFIVCSSSCYPSCCFWNHIPSPGSSAILQAAYLLRSFTQTAENQISTKNSERKTNCWHVTIRNYSPRICAPRQVPVPPRTFYRQPSHWK